MPWTRRDAAKPVPAPSFIAGTSVKGGSSSTSITVTVPSYREAGDRLFLVTSRVEANDPAGWERLADLPGAASTVTRCYTRVSDGTEGNIVITAKQPITSGVNNYYLAALCFIFSPCIITGSQPETADAVPSSQAWAPSAIDAPVSVAIARIDGTNPASGKGDSIVVLAGATLAIVPFVGGYPSVNDADSLFGMAAAMGQRCEFRDGTVDSITHQWSGLSVGLDHA